MRDIKTHHVNECNEQLTLNAVDEPGHGGANHRYEIIVPTAFSDPVSDTHGSDTNVNLDFQSGPIGEVGVNGITHEVLIAILLDRLEGFQRGPYRCDENDLAIAHLESARSALNARTNRRAESGIEGTHQLDKPQ